jgi:putative two-component system hydrogenase maturation factor HypX/HoxX
MSHLVIAGMRGNAGAGGAILAVAADRVYAMSGVVLNPHYRSMGELYGSEYWTYLLPRRVGQERALELTQSCKLIGTKAAREMGFLDDAFGADAEAFEAELKEHAQRLAQDPDLRAMLRKKHESRLDDESVKPLASYRSEELARMKVNFFGPDHAYHEARRRFVFKGNPSPSSRAAIVSQITVGPDQRAVKPVPEEFSLSPRFRGSNGFAQTRLREPRDGLALPYEGLGARVLEMVRKGVVALALRRER